MDFRELSAAEALGFELIVTLNSIKAYLEVSDAEPHIKKIMEKKVNASFKVYDEYKGKAMSCSCSGQAGSETASERSSIFDA